MKSPLFFFCSFVLCLVFASTFAQAEGNRALRHTTTNKAVKGHTTDQVTKQSNSTLTVKVLPKYEMQIIAKKPKRLIGIYCTLSAPIDEVSLEQVGKDCFEKVHGESYNQVMINWYIEGTEKRGKPWGVTNYRQGLPEVAIFAGK